MGEAVRDHLVKEILEKPTRLSDDQAKAVLSKTNYNRIIAGAGAGKTETLTRRIAYLLLIERVEPSAIVAFTFTEKAAQSMKSRIYERVEQLVGSSGTAKLGEMYIGTIHAYAKRVLEDYFRKGNHSVLDENKEIAFLMRHGWNFGVYRKGESYSENCRSFLRTVNMTWDEMLNYNELQRRAPEFFGMLKGYEGLLEEHRQLTFGRMIYLAVQNLREAPDTLSHVKHLIVDEYQDINRAQQELIELVGRSGSIFVVGDPRQSIYQWRGSDERFFEDFTRRFPDTLTQPIRENRRSGRRIVQNANKFADSFERSNFESMEATRTDEDFIGMASLDTPEDEARWIADQVERLVREGNARFSDIGILVRSVSTSAGPLIDEFKERRIPYIVGGKVGLFKRDEAQAVGRIFAWFSEGGFWTPNPWKWQEKVEGDDLITTGLRYWGYSSAHGLPSDAESKIKEIRTKLYSRGGYYNFSELYHDVLNALGFSGLDYRDPNDATVMANLGRFNQLLTDYETAYRIGGRTMKWQSDLKNLCWFMNTYASTAYEEQPSDDIRGVEAVQVMTIHQAKGLEWPVVFLFSLVNSRFPPKLTGREQFWWDVPRDMFDAERYEGSLEDERRLFYVAITRPRDVLVLSCFEKMGRNMGQCVFLNDVDEDLMTPLSGLNLPEVTINPSIMPEELQTFSAKELMDFNFCPHRYLLRDLWGYQPGLQPRLGYGNSLHHCLRVAGEMVRDEGFSPVSAVSTAVEEEFHMPFMGGEVLDTFRERARRTLVEFSRKYGDELSRIEEVEYRLEYPIMNATVMGKVDVVLRDEGAVEVWDYKTSEEAESFDETSLQLRLYTLGLKTLDKKVSGGAVAYLDTPEVKGVAMDNVLLGQAKDYAEWTVARITGRDFVPCPGENCKRCDHAAVCRWRAS
jgi:DNA helicase-2/ATP-dependent DNA helicase PcrA